MDGLSIDVENVEMCVKYMFWYGLTASEQMFGNQVSLQMFLDSKIFTNVYSMLFINEKNLFHVPVCHWEDN